MNDLNRTVKKKIRVGSKIYFGGEKQGYTVQALSENFVICTKPFNARKTYLYCIIDWDRNVRGPDNMIFGSSAPYDTKEGAQKNLEYLERGLRERNGDFSEAGHSQEVSYRRSVQIEITKVV